ncbi:acyltransferase family protein [Arthrobacter yangruifuii]|uniref:Acyltransferase family protein n=1 Tax=Arthrobacter yangruifuii TaxID=2606616 RepID=A0A5N6MIE4_9MICC|nr:acyltransferase family protein [Arthrobacter yangruifuii]KAD3515265.1 acyltransferase family protein [Arthrobacter yangruifuii]
MTDAKVLTSGRIGWIDAGKGLSILLVVLYHSTSWLRSAGVEVEPLEVVNRMLADLRMPVFFFISGIFAAKSVQGSWHDLFAKKLSLFLWIYLLWSILELPTKWLAMWQLTQKIDDGFLLSQVVVVAAIPFRASGALWFIWALAVFFAAAKLTSRWPLWAQFSLACMAALGARIVPTELMEPFMELTGLGPRGCLVFYVFFLAGCYLRSLIIPAVARVGRLAAIGMVLIWAVLWIVLDSRNLNENGYISFLMAFVGCAAGVGCAIVLADLSWLRYIGLRTLSVYVTHSSLLIIVTTMLTFLPQSDSAFAGVTVALASSAFTVATALLFYAHRQVGYVWLFEQPKWLMSRINRVRTS